MKNKFALFLSLSIILISPLKAQSLANQHSQQQVEGKTKSVEQDKLNAARASIPAKANVIQCSEGGSLYAFVDGYIFNKPEEADNSSYSALYTSVAKKGKFISFQYVYNPARGLTNYYELDTEKLVMYEKSPEMNAMMRLSPNAVEENKCRFFQHNSKAF